MACKEPADTPDHVDDILYVRRCEGGKARYYGYRREYLAQNLTELEREIFICKDCEGIMRKASIVNGETTCQLCSETPEQFNAVNLIGICVDKLEVKCPLLKDCRWKGKLSEVETHLKKCKDFLFQCWNCEQVVARGAIKVHKQKICPMRKVKCKYCGLAGKAKDLIEHEELCDEYPIHCTEGCGKKFPRKQLPLHNAECPLAEVECPYAKYGCKVGPMRRRDFLLHKEEFMMIHMDMVETKNHELQIEVESLKSELNTMRKLEGIKWELFKVGKLTDGQIVKSHFYVNKYKLECFCLIGTSMFGPSLNFSVKIVEREHDANLGEAFITDCHLILQNDDEIHSFINPENIDKLRLGGVSNVSYRLPYWSYSSALTPDKSLTVRLHFDVKSQQDGHLQ